VAKRRGSRRIGNYFPPNFPRALLAGALTGNISYCRDLSSSISSREFGSTSLNH
jgi:hypothetical protein